MITLEEKEEIINTVMAKMPDVLAKFEEKLLLSLPEIIGNLIVNHVTLAKISSEFYAKHKEFQNHKELVASVMETMDAAHPEIKDYRELFELAIPEIEKRIAITNSLNMKTVPEPKRDLHGEL